MADVLIARRSAAVVVDGTRKRVIRGRTTAHADAAVAVQYPDLWQPLQVDFAGEGEPTGPAAASTPPSAGGAAPTNKAVRAWAKAEGIDVPARGKIADDVVAQYEAAQGG
jgi:hypothetical protein